ncbi:MAG: nucleotidyltransferase family protein, partial [Alphaproteobacteria bacterium]|nr:nucleotidyltransferase family protein [Alphaproteobacteria bacterium]
MTEQEFLAVVMSNPVNRAIATRLGAMGLNDAWLVSGALFQTVWNLQSGKMPGHGIRDYDIIYFDTDT